MNVRPIKLQTVTALLLGICLAIWGAVVPGSAQQSRVMPLDQVKSILDATKDSWIAYRDFNGRQLIYFTQIVAWHCGIKDIRYSLNGTDLDQRFPVPACNELLPNNITSDDKIYLDMAPDSVSRLAVQLLFDDDSVSDIHVYQPCAGAGEATCGQRIETIPAGNAQ